MAIKRKGQQPAGPSHPAEFEEHVTKALTLQQISDKYKKAFDAEKDWVKGYLENNDDGVTVEQGKALKVEHGSVLFTERANWKIDLKVIEDQILSGEMTIATLLAISTINATKLKDAVGEKKFRLMATNEPTEYLTLKADLEFKAEIDRMFDVETSLNAGAEITAGREAARKDLQAVKPKAAPVAAKQSSLAKAKAAVKEKTYPAVSVDADLDAILKGES